MTLANSIQPPEVPPAEITAPAKHRATYTRCKHTGKVRVRIVGPDAADAAGTEVPVITRDGAVHLEKLTVLIYTGFDDRGFPGYQSTGYPLAIYEIEKRPRVKKVFVF